jgi:hypothetical protein
MMTRILNYLAQELIVKRLANSRAFQRGACRLHEVMESVNKSPTIHRFKQSFNGKIKEP